MVANLPRAVRCTKPVLLVWLGAILTVTHLAAVSVLLGVEPGKSTQAEAERVFGAPVRTVDANTREYVPKGGASSILITYAPSSGLVERIDLQFKPAVAVAVASRQLGLNEPATATTTAQDGRLLEYYGGSKSLVLAHETAAPASAIGRVTYASRELFDREIARLGVAPAPQTPPSTAVTQSNAKDGPVIRQMNPAACSDIYFWAQAEQEVAKRSRNVARRQLMLETLVASQKGDCARARELADRYKRAYSQ